MCGIIGIIGEKDAAPRLLDGLKRLEYRGYDSAGIATLSGGVLQRRRAPGKLIHLEEKLKNEPLPGGVGIGHTRWATHGAATEDNAHPHATDKVAVVHNGIIENYAALKKELQGYGCVFETETDTEVIAHLLTYELQQGHNPKDATEKVLKRLDGAFALVLLFAENDDLLIGVRQGTPLAVGYGEGEMFVASDSYALAPLTQKICFLEDGDRVHVTRDGAAIYDQDNAPVERPVQVTAQSGATAGKGAYEHFMLKEIHEQPAVIGDTLNSFINPATGEIVIPADILDALDRTPRLTIACCGTAYLAGMTAKYWFETLAKLPCELDIASEFRYREPPLPEGGTALFISQSGETLDTLEAMRYCKRQKQTLLSIVNTIESTIERESDHVLHTLAGPEIGVASTKAFTTQLVTLACMALSLALRRGTLSSEEAIEKAAALRRLPGKMMAILKEVEKPVQALAPDLAAFSDMLYLGRGLLYPIALEGALKIKEVSYIHAAGYAAGELKHGPIALVDENMPIAVLAPGNDPLFEKTASNLQENAARDAEILLVSDAAGAERLSEFSRWSLVMREVSPFTAPILYSLPMQLLAYYVAVAKGTDVDQPRNLAKAVTVE